VDKSNFHRRAFQAGQKIAETLQEQLSHPLPTGPLSRHPSPTSDFLGYNLASLSKIESEMGLTRHDETLTQLIKNSLRENAISPANLRLIFHDDRRMFLSRPCGTGKSLFLKTRILPFTTAPFFLIDLAGEYQELKKLGVGDLQIHRTLLEAGLRWTATVRAGLIKIPYRLVGSLFMDKRICGPDGHAYLRGCCKKGKRGLWMSLKD
jgi:hypothetical protein